MEPTSKVRGPHVGKKSTFSLPKGFSWPKGFSLPPDFSVEKQLKKTEDVLKLLAKISSVARAFVSTKAIKSLQQFDKQLKLTKSLSIALTPFNIYYAAKEIKKIVSDPDFKVKVRACFMLLTRLDSIIDSISSTCGILYAFKVVGQKTIDWIPIFNVVSFFVGFISIATAAEGVWDSGKLTHKLGNILKKLENDKLQDYEKAKILGDFLKEVEDGGLTELRKKLMISKKAEFRGRRFEETVTTLSKTLLFDGSAASGNQTKAIEDARRESVAHATEFLKVLAPRVKLELGLGVADLANRVTNTVGKGLITFGPTPPTLIAGYVILATTGAISLLMIGGKFLFINKNPFDPASKNNAQLLVAKIAGGFSHLRDRLHTLALAKGILSPSPLPVPQHT